MKIRICIISLVGLLSISLSSCKSGQKKSKAEETSPATPKMEVITEGIRFCESTYPYKGGLLIANFGTDELNPLNGEGKGYILYYKDAKLQTMIPADGHLNAPKGMYEKAGYLFICDVNKIVVYNLNNPERGPQTIRFSENDLFVNDLAAVGETLYASVTNTGKIYTIDISDLTALDKVTPKAWCDVIGANGIIIDGNTMYVASYPADGNTTPDNVIYRISDLSVPQPEKFTTEAGQYDGIALSADKKTLYVTNWVPTGVYSIDMATKKQDFVKLNTSVIGAADMSLVDGVLYVPDLPNSQVVVHTFHLSQLK